MKLYKIEKGIKVPEVVREGSSGAVSPVVSTMHELKRGESFLVKDARYVAKAAKIMRDFMLRERANDGGREFTSRTFDAGVRIWRVK